MTRGVILQINVNFRRAWFVLYKLILLNKQNLLIMLFPLSLWSEFHFSPVGHGIPCFSMTWISFFSCRSWPFRVSHDLDFIFLLQVMAFPGFPWPRFHFSSVGHAVSGSPMTQRSNFLSGSFCRGRREKKYYIVPHLTKFISFYYRILFCLYN